MRQAELSRGLDIAVGTGSHLENPKRIERRKTAHLFCEEN
jgi:hypothetical protein